LFVTRKQIIFTGLVFHLLAAFFSIGYHQCDELFQVFEFAGYKLGLNNAQDLPWEFHEQMRSGLQPMIVYGLTRFFWSVGVTDPFVISFIVRLMQALFSFAAVYWFTSHFERPVSNVSNNRALWMLSLLFWLVPYFHARFSSENFSATLFVLGLVLMLRSQHTFAALTAGLLFGLAFVTRVQIVFMIAGWFAWCFFITKEYRKSVIPAMVGIGIAAGLGLLIDYWFYGSWTCTWWNYVNLNVFQGKANDFGRSPIYFYFTETSLQLVPPFSFLMIAVLFLFWFRYRCIILRGSLYLLY
jgi:GPI mannosyltransferase 3